MKIFWIKAQAPLRVLALAKHLALPFESIRLDVTKGDLSTPEFTKLNPNNKAPVLVDGNTVLWESLAVMVYLAAKARSSMWPAQDVQEQVEVLRWISWSGQHWDSALAPYYFEQIVKPTLLNTVPDLKALEGKADNLRRWARVLDAHLKVHEFVAGKRLTIADFYLASMARYWLESEMPISDFPQITSWLSRLMSFPAWRDPWPSD